jgi:hypothetical protein
MRAVLFLALVGSLAACSRGGPPTGTPIDPTAVSAADDIFKNRCTPCHGSSGGGDGPASASLSPHPRNFHDKTWQASVDDAHIEQIIQYGGAAVGKSPNMPANPDLQGKAAVVTALAHKVRGFAQ